MAAKSKFEPRKLMEKAIAVMKQSINEPRADKKASPLVGAVLWKPDGTVDTAFRGELRHGDHAEYTLLERKHRDERLDGSVLFATLEPCAPGARKLPVPKYAFDGLYLNLTIYRDAKAVLGSLGETVLNKLSKSERAGWEWLVAKGKAKSGEYAAAMELDERTARRHLNQFLTLGLVRKSGAGPSTDYTIKQ